LELTYHKIKCYILKYNTDTKQQRGYHVIIYS
jgi:hypothetical protein